MNDVTNRGANETLVKILKAFDGPDADMRTVGGVSRDTGLPAQTVEQILQEHPDLFLRSRIGRSTYILRSADSAR